MHGTYDFKTGVYRVLTGALFPYIPSFSSSSSFSSHRAGWRNGNPPDRLFRIYPFQISPGLLAALIETLRDFTHSLQADLGIVLANRNKLWSYTSHSLIARDYIFSVDSK